MLSESQLRFAHTQQVASLTLETRGLRELLEAALPGLVEFDKQLRTNVARHLCEPRELGAQPGELVDLIEGGVETTLIARPSEPQSSLFERKVPQEPQRILPCEQTFDLLLVRINPVAKALVDQHSAETTSVYGEYKRFSFDRPMKNGVFAKRTPPDVDFGAWPR